MIINNVDYHLIGTTMSKRCTSPCMDTFKRYTPILSMNGQQKYKTSLTNTQSQHTEQKSSIKSKRQLPCAQQDRETVCSTSRGRLFVQWESGRWDDAKCMKINCI